MAIAMLKGRHVNRWLVMVAVLSVATATFAILAVQTILATLNTHFITPPPNKIDGGYAGAAIPQIFFSYVQLASSLGIVDLVIALRFRRKLNMRSPTR